MMNQYGEGYVFSMHHTIVTSQSTSISSEARLDAKTVVVELLKFNASNTEKFEEYFKLYSLLLIFLLSSVA